METSIILISIAVGLIAVGIYNNFENRRIETERLRAEERELNRALDRHNGDAYEAARSQPLNQIVVTAAKQQHQNLRDLFLTRAEMVESMTRLMKATDEHNRYSIEREFSNLQHSIKSAQSENELMQKLYAGERIPLEHQVKLARLTEKRKRIEERLTQNKSHHKYYHPGNNRFRRLEKDHEYLDLEQQYLHDLDLKRQQLELERMAAAEELMRNKYNEWIDKYDDNTASELLRRLTTDFDYKRATQYQQG